MSVMADGTAGGSGTTQPAGQPVRPLLARRRLLAAAVTVTVAVVVLLIASPFSRGNGPPGGVSDTAYPTATQTILRRSISQQTQVSATLGYADPITIQLPFGNTGGLVTQTPQTTATQGTPAAAELAHRTSYGPYSMFTSLPSAGAIMHRGQQLYSIDGLPTLLLYGRVVAMRAFFTGMSPGPDVAELNANLDALGCGHNLAGDRFTSATAAGIRRLQTALHEPATGRLLLGAVVFEPGAVRVAAVLPPAAVGSHATPGRVLAVTSTSPQVSMQLDPALEGQIKVGDAVTITLPDNRTIPGRITYVSPVASPGQSGPAIDVDATPSNRTVTRGLDQAPVNVTITTATASNVLVVPVDALLARPSGSYAVEEIGPGRHHHLVGVTTGLFDDADGLVQISGRGVAVAQRVVVPGT